MIPLYVLLPILPVLLRFVSLEIRCVGLPRPDITAVAFVFNDAVYGAGILYLVTQFGLPSIVGKKVSNLLAGPYRIS